MSHARAPLLTFATGAGRALRAETFRLSRHRGIWLLATLPALAAGARILLARLSLAAEANEQIGRQIISGTTGPDAAINLNAYGPLADGLRVGLALGILLLLSAVASLIAGERDAGTIRVPLTRSVSRQALITVKLATALGLAVAVLASALLGALIMTTWLFEFGPYVEDGYEFMTVAELNGEMTRGILLALPALAATACFGLMISTLSRSSGQAISIALGLYMIFDLFKGVMGGVGGLFFATYNPSIADASYLAEVAKLARGFSDAGFEPEQILLARWAPVPQAVLFAAIGFGVFQRRRM